MTGQPRFTIQEDGDWVNIYDDDLGYDAMLKITGDFATPNHAIEFAQAIASALNLATIPTPKTSKYNDDGELR